MYVCYFFAQELCNQIEDFFFLPKAFLIWLKFLAVCLDLNFRTKGQDALIWRKIIAEICLDMTSFSYLRSVGCLELTKISSRTLPWFDENFIIFSCGCGMPRFAEMFLWIWRWKHFWNLQTLAEAWKHCLKLLKYEIFLILSNQAKILHFILILRKAGWWILKCVGKRLIL